MIRTNLPGATLDPTHPLSRGLVGWWLLNEKAGINVGDTSQNNNRGTLTNVVQSATSGWTGEQFGGGIRFDGSDDAVIIPHSSSLNFAANFTYSCWARLTSAVRNCAVTKISTSGVAAPARVEYSIDWGGWIWVTGNGTNHEVQTGSPVVTGKLTHLVGVHQGGTAAGTTNYFYVDTARYGPFTTTVPTANLGTPLYLGANVGFAMWPNWWSGTLSNVRIYNRALSADEVRVLYSQPLAGLLNPAKSRPFKIYFASAIASRRVPIDSGNQIKQSSSAYPLEFLLLNSQDQLNPKIGATPTVKISKNGGAFASPAGAVTEVGSGWYKVAGNATDSNTVGPLLLNATAAGANPTDVKYEVVSHDPFSIPQALDPAGTRSAIGLASANLDTQISTLPSNTLTALGMASGNLDTQLDAIPTADENADGLLDRTDGIWTGWSVRKVLRVIAAAISGKLSGANTNTKRFRDFPDTKDVLVATTAISGRTSVTFDGNP